jgi:hypothetical protein
MSTVHIQILHQSQRLNLFPKLSYFKKRENGKILEWHFHSLFCI